MGVEPSSDYCQQSAGTFLFPKLLKLYFLYIHRQISLISSEIFLLTLRNYSEAPNVLRFILTTYMKKLKLIKE
jgi:hypothetical protein